MRRRLLVVVLALGTLVAACGPPPGPAVGRIVKGEYDDPDEWTTTTWHCSYYEADGTCFSRYPITTYHYDEAHWHLFVNNGKRKGWREVVEEVYNSCRVGRWCDIRTGEVIPR